MLHFLPVEANEFQSTPDCSFLEVFQKDLTCHVAQQGLFDELWRKKVHSVFFTSTFES